MIILDTHVLVWFFGDKKKLSNKAINIIEEKRKEGAIVVSSISAWEIARLQKNGRLGLNTDVTTWVEKTKVEKGLSYLPIDNKVAIESINLPGQFHKDPADRIIVAQARTLSIPLITKDEKILNYPHVETTW